MGVEKLPRGGQQVMGGRGVINSLSAMGVGEIFEHVFTLNLKN